MTIANLATVFAPTLMHDRDTSNPGKFLIDVGLSNVILLYLMKGYEQKILTQQAQAANLSMSDNISNGTSVRLRSVSEAPP